MKKFNKVLSAAISLTLCAALIVPSFAASFTNLDDAIHGTEGAGVSFTREDKTYWGYGDKLSQDGEGDKYAIEAWDEDGTRNVQLNEDVKLEEWGYADKKITVEDEVNLDLNNQSIRGPASANGAPLIEVNGEDASLTLKNGTVDGRGIGSGVAVNDGADLTMKGVTLTQVATGVKVTGGSTFTMEDSTITKNTLGGVRVEGAGSSFTMKSGTISENERGGVRVKNGATFTMENGTITGNNSAKEGPGGGVYVENSTFKMTGGSITSNPTGGIAGINATIDLTAADPSKPIELSGNTGHGIESHGCTVNLDGVSIKNNVNGYAVHSNGNKELTLKNVTLEGNSGEFVVFSYLTQSTIEMENVTIKNNSPTVSTVWANKNDVNIKNSVIENNGDGLAAVTVKSNGSVTINDQATIHGDGSSAAQVGADGSVSGLKDGSIVRTETEDGMTIENVLPDGGDVDKDGNVTSDGAIVSKNQATGNVTIKDSEGNTIQVNVPEEAKQASVKTDGTTTAPEGTKVTSDDVTVTIYPDGVSLDKEGNVLKGTGITVPTGKVDDVKVNEDGSITPNEEPKPEAPSTPSGPNVFPGYDFGAASTTTDIEDEAVPLAAGPVTRAEFIDYLWRHAGSPDAESELFTDHEYASAIAWALDAKLIDEETFQPDELVTVKAVRDILDNFAQVFGTNAVAAEDLTTLTGEDDEAVLNCDEVLAEFFGEEYVPAEVEDDIAA